MVKLTENMKQYMKEYKSTNKFKKRRRELQKTQICECGGKYTKEHKNFHETSRKHNKYLSEKLMKEPLEDFNHPPFHTVDMTYFQPFDLDDIEFV
jgi:hypothetical protein